MPFTRRDIQDSVNRAGEEQMDALIRHHEDAYPESRPTPGDICKAEAARLNQLGLGNAEEFELLETRVERPSDSEVRIQHVFRYAPLDIRLCTEAFTGYSE